MATFSEVADEAFVRVSHKRSFSQGNKWLLSITVPASSRIKWAKCKEVLLREINSSHFQWWTGCDRRSTYRSLRAQLWEAEDARKCEGHAGDNVRSSQSKENFRSISSGRTTCIPSQNVDTLQRTNPIPYFAPYFGYKEAFAPTFGMTRVYLIDGCSRFILGAVTMPIKNPILIYEHLFRPALMKYGLFDQIRMDHGSCPLYLCTTAIKGISIQWKPFTLEANVIYK